MEPVAKRLIVGREESALLPHQSIGGQLTQAKRCKAASFGEVDAA